MTGMSERDFQRKVIDLAQMFNWRVAHFRTAMNARGHYQTPVAADGAGWPDLVLVHPARGQLMFRELKSDTGKLDPKQAEWGAWLLHAGVDWAVWRPADMPTIAARLSNGRATTTTNTKEKHHG